MGATSPISHLMDFSVAYIRSWRLALAMSSVLPCIVLTGAIMNKFGTNSIISISNSRLIHIKVSKWTQLSLGYIAEGGSLAEKLSPQSGSHMPSALKTCYRRYTTLTSRKLASQYQKCRCSWSMHWNYSSSRSTPVTHSLSNSGLRWFCMGEQISA